MIKSDPNYPKKLDISIGDFLSSDKKVVILKHRLALVESQSITNNIYFNFY